MSEHKDIWMARLERWPSWFTELFMIVLTVAAWLIIWLVVTPLVFSIKVIAVFTNSPGAWVMYYDAVERLQEVKDSAHVSN